MMTRHLFIRDDGRNNGDVYPAIEDFLRNVRSNNTEETWEQPVNYRLPHRYQNHPYKLVRDLMVKAEDPNLVMIPKDADQFNLDKVREKFSLNLTDLLDACDQNYAGAAFLTIFDYGVLQGRAITICVKNEDGILVNAESGKPLPYSGSSNNLIPVFLSIFKLGKLPIYVMFLNNDIVINKVWFRNIAEADNIKVYAENIDLKKSIFCPVSKDVIEIGENQLIVSGSHFDFDMYGAREWDGVFERQVSGSEMDLSDSQKPPLITGENLLIETDMEYMIRDNIINFVRLYKPVHYVKIEIDAGPFFRDFGYEFKWEWIIHRHDYHGR